MLPFEVLGADTDSNARRGRITTRHGVIETPAFMTVGTRATVTGMDPWDLERAGTQVVLGNTYHLMLHPGPELFERVGGIHNYMGWSGPVLTDSGGYQIFSMANNRTISERGARFRSYTDQRMHMLTPERSIEMQTAIGSDIMMVLDVCLDSRAEEAEMKAAMDRTHRWALRSLAARTNPEQALFAIVQGGVQSHLRKESAEFLTQHPFDGFAIGGLAVGDTREQRVETTQFTAQLLPSGRPRYLMGVGTPVDLLEAMLTGVDMFDCVIPTFLAWQGTAFTSTGRVRVKRGALASADTPLDEACACRTCERFTRSYLNHLFKCDEPLGARLLAVHNLHYYNQLMSEARTHIEAGTYAAFAKQRIEEIDRHEHSGHRPGRREGEPQT